MPDMNEEYEKLLRRIIARTNRKILRSFESVILTLTPRIKDVKYKGQVFQLADYPRLKSNIRSALVQMHGNIYSTLVNSITESWALSNEKNNRLVDRRLASKNPTKRIREIMYDPNLGARDQFISRKVNGLNLSDRVWNITEQYQQFIEAGLGDGIANGRGARVIAKDLKASLLEPDRIFRRVRNSNGTLKLSNPALAYNPGQGTYRSSARNAQRLSITETNTAYRSSDHERWKNLPFVIGIEIRLSNNHPAYDICDVCAGRYPKDYKFTGWHPHCRCYAIPIMMNDKDYEKLQDSLLGIGEFDPTSVKMVDDVPAGFKTFVQTNKDRIAGWKNTPHWLKDNRKFYNAAVKAA